MAARARNVSGRLLLVLAVCVFGVAALLLAIVALCWRDLRVLRQQAAFSASSHYPAVVVDAVLAVEDPQFRKRPHFNGWSLLRSVGGLSRTGRVLDASTLQQQLVKMNLQPARSWSFAVRSIVVAFVADILIPRDRILAMYLDEAYLGSLNRKSLFGVRAAAQAYFHKTPEQLDVSEAATLAAILPRPNYYSPILHPGRVAERRDMVLRLICEHHFPSCANVRALASRSSELRGTNPQ